MGYETDKFSVRNGLLPLVLVQATIELDNYIIGKETNFNSTKQIQEMLTRTLEQRQQEHVYSLDILALSGGIKRYCGREPANIQEVYSGLESVVKDMVDFKDSEKSKLEKLRNFCMELSTRVSYYQMSIYRQRHLFASI